MITPIKDEGSIASEPKYDNVDITQSPSQSNESNPQKVEKMKTLLTLASEVKGKPDISVVKKEDIVAPNPQPNPQLI